jgi:hypothetical protein
MWTNQDPYHRKPVQFRVQSAADFYQQLRDYHRADAAAEDQIETDCVDLARSMLNRIGVRC